MNQQRINIGPLNSEASYNLLFWFSGPNFTVLLDSQFSPQRHFWQQQQAAVLNQEQRQKTGGERVRIELTAIKWSE